MGLQYLWYSLISYAEIILVVQNIHAAAALVSIGNILRSEYIYKRKLLLILPQPLQLNLKKSSKWFFISRSCENLKPQMSQNPKIDSSSAVFGSESSTALSELDIPALPVVMHQILCHDGCAILHTLWLCLLVLAF